MEFLIKSQEVTYSHISKLQTNFKKSPKQRLTQGYVETRLESLENYWSTFQSNHYKIIEIVNNEKLSEISYFTQDTYESCEDIYFELKGSMKYLLFAIKGKDTSINAFQKDYTQSSLATHTEMKLPRINIPKFTGNYIEWYSFHDLFVSLIHNNKSLSDVQKLHYLKNSIGGEAEQLLRHVAITEANYQQAWNILNKRFNNKRVVVNSILKRITSQKGLTSESSHAIKDLLDTTIECLHALNNLAVPTETWDPIIIYITVSKLDCESHKLWEQNISEFTTELPTFQRLCEFLETRFRTLEILEASKSKETTKITRPKTFHTSITEQLCLFCSQKHYLYHCKEFAKLDYSKRHDFVQTKKLCFNCLIPNHAVKYCRQSSSCRRCGKRHHSLLHPEHRNTSTSSFEQYKQTESHTNDEEHIEPSHTSKMHTQNSRIASHFITGNELRGYEILLATAIVKVTSQDGFTQTLRALIDQGSQASFITEAAAQLLGLRRTPVVGKVTGLGSKEMKSTIQHMVKFNVQSRCNPTFNIDLKAFVLSRITTILPSNKVRIQHWPHLEGLTLADPTYSTPSKIDLLLGADVYGDILKQGLLKGPQGAPLAQNTHLGWILSGQIKNMNNTQSYNTTITMHSRIEIDTLLRQFWEIESDQDYNTKRTLTEDELRCENIYASTHSRASDGRYIVHLPFRHDNPSCQYGDSRSIAIRRLHQLEKRLHDKPDIKNEYSRTIHEYLHLGHMELIENSEPRLQSNAVYLPHHAVIREDKKTTKLRVVFDASCKGSNNVSLNDELLIGPRLQDDLRSIILRWRMHKICFVADIEKMYRQVRVCRKDADYQRIVWRSTPQEQIKDYRLLTVTFGTASAPYLAVKTLLQVASDEEKEYPLAAEIVRHDFYVDDVMSGCYSELKATEAQRQLTCMLRSGGFELKKWSSNSKIFLEQIEPERRESTLSLDIQMDNTIKALGLCWNTNSDNFEFKINIPQITLPITKRKLLADVARLFDPLGWLSPSIIVAKVLIQKLWLAGLSWDEELPTEIREQWLTYRTELDDLRDIKMKRWLHTTDNISDIEIHGFYDASISAFSAVVYCRVITEDRIIHVSLLTAKTKVAPIKQISIPRLELCGAVLLAKLIKLSKGRGLKTYKGYIALFICMSTRAIHLELVSDLTT